MTMKTLDEVIQALEWCISDTEDDCAGCPYDGEDGGCHQRNLDALHYLKEYQRLQIAFLKALADLEDNPSLTWDELKQMEGKPVWIMWTVKGEWNHGDWNLVHAQLDDRVWFTDGNGEIYDLPQDQQGIFWQAYRKERE